MMSVGAAGRRYNVRQEHAQGSAVQSGHIAFEGCLKLTLVSSHASGEKLVRTAVSMTSSILEEESRLCCCGDGESSWQA